MGSKNKNKEYSCDLCESSEAVEVPYCRLYTGNQPIHICKDCGFVYVRNRRSAKEIVDQWDTQYYGKDYTARIPAVKARQTYVADTIDVELGLKNKNVCDIGTGEGQFLQIIRDQYGAKVFGTEAASRNSKILSKLEISHFCGKIEDYCKSEYAKKYRADIVTIMWTLENTHSCTDMMDVAYDIVRPNGYVVVATGSRILVPFKKPLFTYLSERSTDSHAFRFSANTMQGLLARSGFETIFVNKYLDSDVLCLIGKRTQRKRKISWPKDDYLKVAHFFERWHWETINYR